MTERPRDLIWDALTAHFGEVRSDLDRGRRNAAVKELKDADATPEEVKIACDYIAAKFPSHSTEMAVVAHFGRAQFEHQKMKERTTNVVSLADVRRMANRDEKGT